MELETKKILEEKLEALKKFVFDKFTEEYNSKVCKRNYTTLKSTITQYRDLIDDIDHLIAKYCEGWLYTL